MKCIRCGTEFDEGVFCPECGQKYEGIEIVEGEEAVPEMDVIPYAESDDGIDLQLYDGDLSEVKKPFLLSIPVIFIVGLFTCGVGAFIMTILRLMKYSERRKSSIVLLAIWGVFLLLVIGGKLAAPDPSADTNTASMMDSEALDQPQDLEVEEETADKAAQAAREKSVENVKKTGAGEISREEIYAAIMEWEAAGFRLTELGFPKNDIELSSICHIETEHKDRDDDQSDLIAEVEFQEEGYHYYMDFIYGYAEEEGWYVKDVEECRGDEWVMAQLADKEISAMFLEKEANGDEYKYTDIKIEQKQQEYTTFMAETSCKVSSTEGTKSVFYVFTWNWENERWNFEQMQEPEPSVFEPLKEPDDGLISEFISQSEQEVYGENDSEKGQLELVSQDWDNAEDEYAYLYKYVRIENSDLVEKRQNMDVSIRFDRETGYWDYESIRIQYDGEPQKIHTISGIWEGLEYETYEASWSYVIEILSVEPDNNAITINSWCEFTPNGGETEKTSVCAEERLTARNGEYVIPIGGYIVSQTASNGMDFTYEYVVDNGTLFINEESDVMYLSARNSQMSTFLGIEMHLRK